MRKIDTARLMHLLSDDAWAAIEKSGQADARVEDVLAAAMLVHVSVLAHRRFGNWCWRRRDVNLTYLDGLALRLQELDDGSIEFTSAAAAAISRARAACDD
jgi:hypothetical protein